MLIIHTYLHLFIITGKNFARSYRHVLTMQTLYNYCYKWTESWLRNIGELL